MQIQSSINSAAIFQPATQPGQAVRRSNDEAQLRSEKPLKDNEANRESQKSLVRFDAEQLKVLDQQNKNAQYDQPSGKSRLAIQAYVGVNSIEQRESVQQVLGVDVFA